MNAENIDTTTTTPEALTRAEHALVTMLSSAASHHAGMLAAGQCTDDQRRDILATIGETVEHVVIRLREPGPNHTAAELGEAMATIAAGAVLGVLGYLPRSESMPANLEVN